MGLHKLGIELMAQVKELERNLRRKENVTKNLGSSSLSYTTRTIFTKIIKKIEFMLLVKLIPKTHFLLFFNSLSSSFFVKGLIPYLNGCSSFYFKVMGYSLLKNHHNPFEWVNHQMKKEMEKKKNIYIALF